LKKRAQAEPNPTDGWRFDQCSNQDLRDVLKFLILLIKPNKPTRLNVGPIATIADCLFGDLKVSWANVFSEVVEKEVEKIDTHKDSYLPAYLIHLYQDQKALTKEKTRKFIALKRTMAMENPEEEEEQEKPAKIVTEEFINLSDQEEPTKQEKKSDQAIHQDKGRQAAKETKEDIECGPRHPCWEKMSRMEHPSSKERMEEFNKYGIGRRFLFYVKAEQV
jgi:hypothetical protein